MYKAVVYFTDLQDDRYAYNPGDVFPREGLKVSAERIAELAGSNNKRGYPVIKLAEQEKPAEPVAEPVIETVPIVEPEPVFAAEPEPEPVAEPVPEEDIKIAEKPRKGRRKKNAD